MSEQDLGYRFDPPCAHDDPCHRQLTVWLLPAPTERHYDPTTVQCTALAPPDGLEQLEIEHPWSGGARRQLYPGRIILKDRIGAKVEAFTFGGELSIESDGATICVFKSPAPLLPILEAETTLGAFASEVEVILAERRAHWEMQGTLDVLQQRLAETPPLELYLICLRSVEEHFKAMGQHLDESDRKVLHFARRQREKLSDAGHWPAHVPSAEEAL